MTNNWSFPLSKKFIINSMDNISLSSIIDNPFPNIISIFFIFRYLRSFVVAASASPLPHFFFFSTQKLLSQPKLLIHFFFPGATSFSWLFKEVNMQVHFLFSLFYQSSLLFYHQYYFCFFLLLLCVCWYA